MNPDQDDEPHPQIGRSVGVAFRGMNSKKLPAMAQNVDPRAKQEEQDHAEENAEPGGAGSSRDDEHP